MYFIFENSAPFDKCLDALNHFQVHSTEKDCLKELLYTLPTLLISFQTYTYENKNKIPRLLHAHVAHAIIEQ